MMQNRWVRFGVGFAILGVILAAIIFGIFLLVTDDSGVSTTPVSAPTLEAENNTDETRTLFRIVPDESNVRFIINEELFGTPTEVVGETNQVAGDLLVDFQTPANTELGAIRIDLARMATPNEMRNRALRRFILEATSAEFQYAEFVTTALSGLPDTVTVGETFSFQITGNLSVHGATNEVTFEATVTPVSETRLEGSATTQVLYPDYNMTIPNAPGVANVTEEVGLEINFVAIASSDAEATAEATPAG
ncbi:MAG: YceI family protein [Anaerolineae bacterium]